MSTLRSRQRSSECGTDGNARWQAEPSCDCLVSAMPLHKGPVLGRVVAARSCKRPSGPSIRCGDVGSAAGQTGARGDRGKTGLLSLTSPWNAVLLAYAVLCCGCAGSRWCGVGAVAAVEVDVAAWNVQTFGVSKMSDPAIASVISSVVGE
jgi:hypothetical protein